MDIAVNGHVIVELWMGMYGLPQAGRIASDDLKPHLAKWGYKESNHTHGLFKHKSNGNKFSLVVDDFLLQYVGQANQKHLQDCLEAKYKITIDREAHTFCGLHLEWDYIKRTCLISMPGYVQKALLRFKHSKPHKPVHSPHPYTEIQYGAKTQYAEVDDSTPLDQDEKLRLQQVIGTFLYYARAVDNTMLASLGSLAGAQSQVTQKTMQAMMQLLNYAATHPDAQIMFTASGMILYIESDASYLSEPKARSRVGGYFFLSNQSIAKDQADAPPPSTDQSTSSATYSPMSWHQQQNQN